MKKILTQITSEKLTELGFTKHEDGSGDPGGVWWTKENEQFEITVSPWLDVDLNRKFKDSLPTDSIRVEVNDIHDLMGLISFIEAEEVTL